MLVESLTDNRNRAAADVRTALTRNGGSMADPGSVSYLFNRKGVVIVGKAAGVTEDDVLAAVLDAGAEEVNDLGESFEVVSEATDLVAVRSALQQAGIDYESAEAAFLPSVEVPLDEEQAKRVFRLIEAHRGLRRRAGRLRELLGPRRGHGAPGLTRPAERGPAPRPGLVIRRGRQDPTTLGCEVELRRPGLRADGRRGAGPDGWRTPRAVAAGPAPRRRSTARG